MINFSQFFAFLSLGGEYEGRWIQDEDEEGLPLEKIVNGITLSWETDEDLTTLNISENSEFELIYESHEIEEPEIQIFSLDQFDILIQELKRYIEINGFDFY